MFILRSHWKGKSQSMYKENITIKQVKVITNGGATGFQTSFAQKVVHAMIVIINNASLRII